MEISFSITDFCSAYMPKYTYKVQTFKVNLTSQEM